MTRRLLLVLATLAIASPSALAGSLSFDVAKTASCGCCKAWIEHIRAAGHKVETSDMDMGLSLIHI